MESKKPFQNEQSKVFSQSVAVLKGVQDNSDEVKPSKVRIKQMIKEVVDLFLPQLINRNLKITAFQSSEDNLPEKLKFDSVKVQAILISLVS